MVDPQFGDHVGPFPFCQSERGPAEGHAGCAMGARTDGEAAVLPFAHLLQILDPGTGQEKPDRRIAVPERLQLLDLLGQVEPQVGTPGHGVKLDRLLGGFGADP